MYTHLLKKINCKMAKEADAQTFYKGLLHVCSPSRSKIQAWRKCQLQGRKDSVFVVVIVMHPS